MRLKQLRIANGLTQKSVAEALSIARNTYNQYETGKRAPDIETLCRIASFFGVSVDYLVGHDEETGKLPKRTIPVLGTIPAGVPMEAIEDIIDYEDLSPEEANDSHEYFGLKIRGRSMMPEYLDGDTIIVRKQDTAQTGDDAVVLVNGDDATFKRLQISKDGITLIPLNTAEYSPVFYTNSQIEALPVRVLGVCVELRRKKG